MNADGTRAPPAGRLGRVLRASTRDVVILVLGILIAFSLDAWWDTRRDARREAVYRQELNRKFTSNVELLEGAHAVNEASIEAAHELADMVATRDTGVDRAAFDRALARAFRLQFFDPAVGASGRAGRHDVWSRRVRPGVEAASTTTIR